MTEQATEPAHDTRAARSSLAEIALVSTRLGLTSFGGPVAHLGYFRAEYVERRRWLSDAAYADLVALCQFLPGPASSQVGIGIGLLRGGLVGGLVAWLGFTLPSAAALTLFALSLSSFDLADAGWLHGLKVVAVAIVAQAVWGMMRSLAPDRPRATIAILSALVILSLQTALSQIAVILVAGLLGWRLLRAGDGPREAERLHAQIPRALVVAAWVAFIGLLVALPLARRATDSHVVAMVDTYFRVGSLVFGGGHVVLPLLQAEVVPDWVSRDSFIAGYGAAQAVPGPLFTFAAYLGAVSDVPPGGVTGAAIALGAIFAPSFLLMVGALPLWSLVRARDAFQSALRGVNASVVGILGAALYDPVWTSAIGGPLDVALALGAFGLLQVWRVSPWLVVALAAGAGQALAWG
ncbi:MAG: chromate efflux transporter [Dehalococcoidia bacterium]|nr:chromate efflux transporter [Dehalococcoidia bacterium]